MNILILGGSGFVGLAICSKLVAPATASPSRPPARPCAQPVPAAQRHGGREAVYDAGALARLAAGMPDAVINLVGVLSGDFERSARGAHAERHRRLQVGGRVALPGMSGSAPKMAPATTSANQGQGRGRGACQRLDYTIFAPSVIFGRGTLFPQQVCRDGAPAAAAHADGVARRFGALPAGGWTMWACL